MRLSLRAPLLVAPLLLFSAGCLSLRPYADVVRELPAERLLEIDGQRVSIERRGEGPPLVLLHGFGESTEAFAPVLSELARRFSVVAIDLNGFGFTERPRDRESYTLAGQQRLVLAVLDRLGLERVRLAGHSYGGAISLCLAVNHPQRIDRLLLIDNALPIYASARRNSFFRWRWLAGFAARTFAISDRKIEQGLREAYFDDRRVTPELVRSYADRLRIEGAGDAFLGLVGPSKEPPYRIDLAAVKVPTLVVWGAEDRLIEAAEAEVRTREIPDSRFALLPACGHTPTEECPEAFLRAALPFLEPAEVPATSVPASSGR